jgi:hypothetical protein
MQEYKRDRNSLETRLKDMTKKALHHDEHLMLIDAWFSEVSTVPDTYFPLILITDLI